jgi:hypothetical protein
MAGRKQTHLNQLLKQEAARTRLPRVPQGRLEELQQEAQELVDADWQKLLEAASRLSLEELWQQWPQILGMSTKAPKPRKPAGDVSATRKTPRRPRPKVSPQPTAEESTFPVDSKRAVELEAAWTAAKQRLATRPHEGEEDLDA